MPRWMPLLAQPRLLGAQSVVADGPQGRLEPGLEVAAVVDQRVAVAIRDLQLVRQVGRGQEVAPSQLGRVHGELPRQAVHDAVHREHGLGAARAAIGRVRRLGGHHPEALDVEVRHAMRAQQVGHRVVGQHDAPGVVGAQVHPDAIAHRQHGPVPPGRDLDVVHLGAGVGRAHHVLAAVLGPLHRPARQDGRGGDQQVLRIAVGLGAEAAAHVRGDDPDLVERQPERGHQPLLHEVDDLGAVPRGERAVARVPPGDHSARLDRHAHVARDHEALAHPRVGLAERRPRRRRSRS